MKNEKLEILRHSAAHVMAQAVKRLFPDTKLAIGPAIENGFYYDLDLAKSLNEDDLELIEREMAKIIKENFKFEKQIVKKEEAVDLFKKLDEPYKLELIENIEDDAVTVYRNDDFVDLCRGPHLDSTGQIKAFKLLSVAGAYWRGNENNKMLQRVYGTAFESKEELKAHLNLIEEVKKRDHRVLGNSLDLFSFHEEIGAGLVLYHPKGAVLRNVIEEYLRKEHIKSDYQLVVGPHIMRSDIWQRSGHYDFYKEHMYMFKIENQEYAIKPMNCPGHILVYAGKIRSYKELPLRFFELGTVYRHEKSGVLHGLLRVRGFTQDDAHIFCAPLQLGQEIMDVIHFVIDTMEDFGFRKGDLEFELSTRPEKYIGTDEDWQEATFQLKRALEDKKLPYDINEGDGAFYGPKIDIKLKDALGRAWQCATIQCDFALPERFDLHYIDDTGKQQRPVMLHRVIVGSLERFIGCLIEHYAGAFPVWLSPVQVKVIPVSERHESKAKDFLRTLKYKEIRAEIDLRSEKLNYKIRAAVLEKVPYIVVIGDKEVENQTLSIRCERDVEKGKVESMPIDSFIERLEKDIKEKR
ncbi:MAG: threonine--tRNA ligase [Candidatus Omnitrophota bacterium]